MKYLLDTNACIHYINGRSSQLQAKLSSMPRQDILVSSITKAEMYYGVVKSQIPQLSQKEHIEFLQTVYSIPFDDAAATEYGTLRAHLERQGTPISANDSLSPRLRLRTT